MKTLRASILAALLIPCATQMASAVCTPFLCYIDLGAGGTSICPNTAVFSAIQSNPVVSTPYNSTCTVANWRAVVATVNIPTGCTGVSVWVQYSGEPEGFTADIADSPTDDGFGGDAGSSPAGQNAEVQVLDDNVEVYNAATVPSDVDQFATQQVSLKDGALNFVVKDQFVSWGNPYTALSSTGLKRLFFLPANPVAPDNRTIYVGLNRVVSPISAANGSRNGCGARRAILVLQ